MPGFFLGGDIGGHSTTGGVCPKEGQAVLSQKRSFTTRIADGPKKCLHQLATVGLEVARAAGYQPEDLLGAGVIAPGPNDIKKGTMVDAGNFPGWADFPLVDTYGRILEEMVGRPVPVGYDNDANGALFGEAKHGAAKGKRSAAFLGLGSGVGGALMHEGLIVHGRNDSAGELGHIIIIPERILGIETPVSIPCPCKGSGCLEALVSANAIEAKLACALAKSAPGSEFSEVRETFEQASQADMVKLVFDLAREGKRYCLNIVDEVAYYLAIGIENILRSLSPEIVIIGGSMAKSGAVLMDRVLHYRGALNVFQATVDSPIAFGELLDDAGWIGSAELGRLAYTESA